MRRFDCENGFIDAEANLEQEYFPIVYQLLCESTCLCGHY